MHYDYVIVGGGPAGSVLGNFLLQNNKTNVLIIEKIPFLDTIFENPYSQMYETFLIYGI